MPFTVGAQLADALDDHSGAVRTTASVIAWTAWAAIVVALLIPRTVSLTALRLVAPAVPAAAVWAAVVAGLDAVAAVGLSVGFAVAALALSALVGDVFVDGSSYGPERRVGLRVPTVLLVGPAPAAWTVAVTGVLAGPLLLAARQWVAGGIALVVGVPMAAAAVRAIHQLSRRWLVFVPAGLVVHDLSVLREPVLLPRALIAAFGPAPVESAAVALDLTRSAPGLALRLALHEPLDLVLAGSAQDSVTTTEMLVAPSRPGATLAEAAARRIPIG